MKILGLEGSPRKNGNTEKLVKTILDGAAEKGADTTFYKLVKMNISLCLGCTSCRETGTCVTEDDMQLLHEEIQASDAIILGSPVYMWQVSGQTKLFMDRLVPFIKPDFTSRLKGKKRVFMVFTQGNPDFLPRGHEIHSFFKLHCCSNFFGMSGCPRQCQVQLVGPIKLGDRQRKHYFIKIPSTPLSSAL